VANVVGPAPRHLERAVFADGLSPRAVAAAQAWVEEAWHKMAADLAPFIEKLIAEEAHEPDSARQQRFRAGLYAFTERDDGAPGAAATASDAPLRTPPAPPGRTTE